MICFTLQKLQNLCLSEYIHVFWLFMLQRSCTDSFHCWRVGGRLNWWTKVQAGDIGGDSHCALNIYVIKGEPSRTHSQAWKRRKWPNVVVWRIHLVVLLIFIQKKYIDFFFWSGAPYGWAILVGSLLMKSTKGLSRDVIWWTGLA